MQLSPPQVNDPMNDPKVNGPKLNGPGANDPRLNDARPSHPRGPHRPISMVMLNLLILLLAIGAFNFALALVNLTNHFSHASVAHTPAALKTLVICASSILMAIVAGIFINRAILRLKALAAVSE
jgi:drug/metabolite transporter (DMT)-like permease